MATVTVSSKGQIVIPQEVRRKLGIEPGSRLEVVAQGSGFQATVDPQRKVVDAKTLVGIAGYKGPAISIEEMDALLALESQR